MPDNPHSKKLAFERDLMEQTGRTRGQVRAALSQFDQQERTRAAQVEQQQTNVPQPTAARTTVTTSEVKMEPRAFRDNAVGVDGRSGTPITISGILDGVYATKTLLEA